MDSYATGIYEIENVVSGKTYIGSAVNFSSRWGVHIHHLRNGTHHNKPLQNSFKKHGESAFIFKKIVLCDEKNLLVYEQLCIDRLNPAYNVARIAGRTTGYKHSPETKSKFHLRTKAKMTDAVRAKISAANRGKSISVEQRTKISNSMIGVKHTSERREKQSSAKVGILNTGRSKPVVCLDTGVKYESSADAARSLGLNVKSAAPYISATADGKYIEAYGLKWGRV